MNLSPEDLDMLADNFDLRMLRTKQKNAERKSDILLAALTGNRSKPPQGGPQPVIDLTKTRKRYQSCQNHINFFFRNAQKLEEKVKRQNRRLKAQSMRILDQESTIQKQSKIIEEQQATLADLRKRLEEWDRKYRDFAGESGHRVLLEAC